LIAATTLCWCWRLSRRDGVVLGFTDHDRDVVFDDTTFEADSGMSASEIQDTAGLNVDNLEIDGAVTSERLAQDDLAAGLYDDASVEVFRVNWSNTDQRVLMRSGSLGEVKRRPSAFAAEVRGLTHYLQQTRGRLFQYTCDAQLGDARCGVDLQAPPLTASVTVESSLEPNMLVVSGLDGVATGFFSHGTLTFETGQNHGQTLEIKDQRQQGPLTRITVWTTPAYPVAPLDAAVVRAGCDKTLATCRSKFANAVNFRGFAFMPGTDLLTRIAGPR